MKNMYKLALLAALGLGSITAAQAQYADGDLTIGFTSSTADYVVDLGAIPTAANTQLGGALSGSLAAYNSVGVIAGDPDGVIDPAGNFSVWTTTLRTGVAATSYASAGTESKPATALAGAIDSAVGIPGGLAYGTTGTTAANDWSTEVSQSSTLAGSATTSWASLLGNPSAATGTLTLDLWTTTDANVSKNTFSYVGDLQINTATDSVIFDAVPEPATYGLLSGAGMLLLGLRRQFSRKA